MPGVKAPVASIAEMERQKAAMREIDEIQSNFAVFRHLGIWTSAYPQIGFSRILGVNVREIRAKDMIR